MNSATISLRDRYRGALLGLACGDAVGTTVEFSSRGTFAPVADMVGGGPFDLAPGQWTDDTSMALCLAESLLEQDDFDPADQMRRYLAWYREGYLSSTGECFDIGMTVRQALDAFEGNGRPFAGSTDPNSAGNGSLMRLVPVVLRYYPDRERVVHYAALSSRTTHAAPEAVECCQLFAWILANAMDGQRKRELLESNGLPLREPKVAEIARGTCRSKRREEVFGIGYCVAALEAALWCFHTTDSFEGAVLAAANLGNDADTTAAIAGQLAGAHYGVLGIPQHWLARPSHAR